MMRGRRDDEDDDRSLSPTSQGHTTRGKFLRYFARISFVRSPRARPGRPGWPGLAGWMKAQIRAKSRNRGRDWADFRRPDEKNRVPGASPGSWLEMLLCLYTLAVILILDVAWQSPQLLAMLWLHENSRTMKVACTRSLVRNHLSVELQRLLGPAVLLITGDQGHHVMPSRRTRICIAWNNFLALPS
jgi:hypothetical protein